MTSGFQLASINASIHIQIKPVDTTLNYTVYVRFGANPTQTTFDLLFNFSANDLLVEGNDSFYLAFANMSRVHGFTGYVGFSVVESSSDNFTSNFYVRTFASGCYYLDTRTNEWSSDGMEILADTNMTHTHCLTTHLTAFAGGFVVLPDAIDFSYVWSHASFTQNPLIYSTVICLICVYILMAVWARYMDWRDEQKQGITLLMENNGVQRRRDVEEGKYVYQMTVFTGQRVYAGTKSKVKCVISSDSRETKVIELVDSKRRLFNRSGIDSFLLVLNR